MPQLLQLLLRILLERWILRHAAARRREYEPTETATSMPELQDWRPTFRDGLFDVGGFDAQLAREAPIRAQKRLLWITWAAVFASAVFGLGAGATAWLALDSPALAAGTFLVGAGFLMNLLRLLNAGASKSRHRPLPQWWSVGLGPFLIVGALSFCVGQPLLVIGSSQIPGGSVEETRAALVAMQQRRLNERHQAAIVKLQSDISALEFELAVLQEEFRKVGTNPDRSYGPAYLQMVYRDRELKGRIAYLRERLDALDTGEVPRANLDAFGTHVDGSTLLAHRLDFLWSHLTFAIPGSLMFVGLCSVSLALRWLLLRGMNEYLDQRWVLDRQLVDRHGRLTDLVAEQLARPWRTAAPTPVGPALPPRALRARLPKAAPTI